MHGVGVDVGGVGVRASSVHEPVQYGWSISYARQGRSPRRCRTVYGVNRSRTSMVSVAWIASDSFGSIIVARCGT